MPTGTAMRIAFCVDSRPTPIAIGASSAAESASTRNQPLTAPCESRNDGEHLARRLVEHVGVVEDAAEGGEAHVGQHGREDQQRRSELAVHDVSLFEVGSCGVGASVTGGRDPGDEDVVGVVDEVVAGERVDEVALAAQVRGGDGHELAVAGRRPPLPRPGP